MAGALPAPQEYRASFCSWVPPLAFLFPLHGSPEGEQYKLAAESSPLTRQAWASSRAALRASRGFSMTRPAWPEKSMATRVLSETLLCGLDRTGEGSDGTSASLARGLGASPPPPTTPCEHSPRVGSPQRVGTGGGTGSAGNSYTAVPQTARWTEKEGQRSHRRWRLRCGDPPRPGLPRNQATSLFLAQGLPEARAATLVLDQGF